MDRIPRWKDWPHVLEMQQFDAVNLKAVLDHSRIFEDALYQGKEVPWLSKPKQRRIRTLFYQASTRTEAAFLDAAQLLNVSVHPVKDPMTFSSAAKGESFEYAIAAFTRAGGMGRLRGCDGIIIRHHEDGACKRAANVIDTTLRDNALPLFVINAGDGKNGQHPSQAFTDLATIDRMRPGRFLQDLTILFPGELHRSRVVNSLLYAFGLFGSQYNIKVIFCCPRPMGPKQELLDYLSRHGVAFQFIRLRDFARVIPQADVIYMTRPQTDEDQPGDKQSKKLKRQRQAVVFRREYLELLRPGGFVMHPLPINENPNDPPAEIDRELAPLAFVGDPRCVWVQQSHRKFPTAAALFDIIFAGIEQEEQLLKAA